MSDYQFCKVEREGRLTIVTLKSSRSHERVARSGPCRTCRGLRQIRCRPEQWVAIVTGAGERAFSAGNDLKVTAAGGARITMPESGFAGLTSRYDLEKPVIAAVNGIAMGGGFEIALACDLIIAADTAVFALPEPRVGLAALAGGLHRLPRERSVPSVHWV